VEVGSFTIATKAAGGAAQVDGQDYQVPFRFAGKLSKLTVKLGPNEM
jgi:hypothetical protein